MGMPCNAVEFDKFVDEEIEWLKDNAPDGYYRRCIVERMEMAKKYYREVVLPKKPKSAWNG